MKKGQKTPKKLEFRLKNKENRQKAGLKPCFWVLIETNRDESACLGRRAGRRASVSKSGLSRRDRDGWQVWIREDHIVQKDACNAHPRKPASPTHCLTKHWRISRRFSAENLEDFASKQPKKNERGRKRERERERERERVREREREWERVEKRRNIFWFCLCGSNIFTGKFVPVQLQSATTQWQLNWLRLFCLWRFTCYCWTIVLGHPVKHNHKELPFLGRSVAILPVQKLTFVAGAIRLFPLRYCIPLPPCCRT